MNTHVSTRARAERMPAHGSSMFPFVPAGSTLDLCARTERLIRVGDIVCFLDARGELVAHRVLARDGHGLIIGGDALEVSERIHESAIGWVVERVARGRFGYRTDGLFGRALARVAVRRGPTYRALSGLARVVLSARRA